MKGKIKDGQKKNNIYWDKIKSEAAFNRWSQG